MFYKKDNLKNGFVKEIILIIIAIAVLSYFNFSIKDFLDREVVKDNFRYVWDQIIFMWNNYLADTFRYIVNLLTPLFDTVLKVLRDLSTNQ